MDGLTSSCSYEVNITELTPVKNYVQELKAATDEIMATSAAPFLSVPLCRGQVYPSLGFEVFT